MVTVPIGLKLDDLTLPGDLGWPGEQEGTGREARRRHTGLVLFAHGSGSSRFSPRNRRVASRLRLEGLATLLFDLLSEEEEERDRSEGSLRFDMPLLSRRLIGVLDALTREPEVQGLPIGLFGASTGAAAALRAAAARPQLVRAVVSRGGRPDLVPGALPRIQCPTLLLVGAEDREVLALNRQAAHQLRCQHRLDVIPAASHLFEEPGALEQVAARAGAWFLRWLKP